MSKTTRTRHPLLSWAVLSLTLIPLASAPKADGAPTAPLPDRMIAILGVALPFEAVDLLANDTFEGALPTVEITEMPSRGSLESFDLGGLQAFSFLLDPEAPFEAPADPGTEVTFRYRLRTAAGPSPEATVTLRLAAAQVPLAGRWDVFDCGGAPCPAERVDLGRYSSAASSFRLYRTTCPTLRAGTCGPAESVTLEVPRRGYGWEPLVGDWNGDGEDDLGLRNPLDGQVALYEIRRSCPLGGSHPCLVEIPAAHQGRPQEIPVVGRWAIGAPPALGLYDLTSGWFRLSPGGPDPEEFEYQVYLADSRWRPAPLAGDWDGDGRDTVGVFDLEERRLHYLDSHTQILPDEFEPDLSEVGPVGAAALAFSARIREQPGSPDALGLFEAEGSATYHYYLFPLGSEPRGGGGVHVTIPKDPDPRPPA